MSALRTAVEDYIPEGSTWLFQGVIRDETGAAIPAASLTTLTLTIYAPDMAGKPLVNAVDGVNILNTGRGAVDANGNLSITFLPADQVYLGSGVNPERHIAEVEWTWSAGAKAGKHEIVFKVWDLVKA